MAPQSGPVMLPTPASFQPGSNNQEAVAGRLRQLYRESQQRAPASAVASSSKNATSASPPPGCPMHAGGSSSSSSSSDASSGINPLNNMPFNLNLPSSSSSSSGIELSRERTISSIRRGQSSAAPGASPYDKPANESASACPVKHSNNPDDQPSMWEYPSPEQFQAALARKNKAAPMENVEMMVLVHNFLNEEGWKLVLDWEKDFNISQQDDISLLKFEGKPGQLSLKAKWYQLLGTILPNSYASTLPFDRHDWIVGRHDGSTARYIIDYYGDDEADAKDAADESDQARFVLDVRPAMDSFAAIKVRASRAFKEWQEQNNTSSPSN
ncbi:unnamed protein product [Sympodiomycopsis kandeliae]